VLLGGHLADSGGWFTRSMRRILNGHSVRQVNGPVNFATLSFHSVNHRVQTDTGYDVVSEFCTNKGDSHYMGIMNATGTSWHRP